MKSMPSVRFDWALGLIAAGALCLSSCSNKDAELATQRAKELEAARAELEQLKAKGSPAQAEEIARLKKENQELLRLRNQVRQLLDEKKQLSQQAQSAATQVEQARALAQQAQARAQQAQAQATQTQAQAQQFAQPLSPEEQAAIARYAALPSADQTTLANACVNYLRQIDGAKQQWALENRKNAAAVPVALELAPYFKDGLIPKCPAGGTYILGSVGTPPRCSIPGHALQ